MISNESFKATGALAGDIDPAHLAMRGEPLKVLMCSPVHFDIVDVKNIHMEGKAEGLDRNKAVAQWESLKAVYQNLLEDDVIEELAVLPGAPGCEDMVFCANQTFPWAMS